MPNQTNTTKEIDSKYDFQALRVGKREGIYLNMDEKFCAV